MDREIRNLPSGSAWRRTLERCRDLVGDIGWVPELDGTFDQAVEFQSVFEAAVAFGLSDEEVWEVVRKVADEAPADTSAPLPDVVEALARRIEEKGEA